jgi:ketosteroid isomerase-like protein
LISALEHEWRDALCAKDMDRLRALIHPQFQLIASRSTGPFTMCREEWLDAIQKREPLSIHLKIADAVVLDQVMVGTIHARWQLRYLGREIEDCVLLTDVWVFDAGSWRVVRRHSSPAPAEGCPS